MQINKLCLTYKNVYCSNLHLCELTSQRNVLDIIIAMDLFNYNWHCCWLISLFYGDFNQINETSVFFCNYSVELKDCKLVRLTVAVLYVLFFLHIIQLAIYGLLSQCAFLWTYISLGSLFHKHKLILCNVTLYLM